MVPTWDASTTERGLGYYTMMLAHNLCFLKHILKIHLQKSVLLKWNLNKIYTVFIDILLCKL